MAARARPRGCACRSLATNEPRSSPRGDRPLLDVLTCIREHTTLDAAGRLLARNSERFMKSGAGDGAALRATARRRWPIPASWRCGSASRSKDLGYRFPDYPLPPGETPIGFLRALCRARARATRYGTGPLAEKARAADRARARPDRPPRPGRLFPHRLGPGPVLPRATTSWCRGAARPPTARCATRSASPRSIRWAWSCSSSASSPRSAASGPTSTSTCRAATGARRSSSTSTSATGASARP